MRKLELGLDIHDEKTKCKAMQTVAGVLGIQSIHREQNNKKLTIIGNFDPVLLVTKLRKHCLTTVVSLVPASEAKKNDPKKEQGNKPDHKKDGAKDAAARAS